MKKLLTIVAAVMLVAICAVSVAAEGITVKLNDQAIDFTPYGVEPQIINSRTMVPLRSIFEALDATVSWDDATKTVTSTRGDVTVKVTIGADALTKNGEAVALDSPAVIVDSRTLVPVRAISESFGCEVGWDDATKTVIITDAAEEVVPDVYTSLPKQTFDNGEIPAGFYTEEAKQTLTVEKDPEDETNNVLKITPTSEEKFWAYIWFNKFEFKAGATYKFSADVYPYANAAGTEFDSYSSGLCFRFLGKDHSVLPPADRTVPGNTWSHIEAEYTIPADFVIADNDRLGVFFNPSEELGVGFYADNIAVELISEGDGEATSVPEKPAEAEKPATPSTPASGDKLTTLPTQTFDDDNAIGFYCANGDQTLSVEADPDNASNKVVKITAVAQRKFWSYVWLNKFQYQPGKTYKFSAKVRPVSDVDGNALEQYVVGLCFHFLGKDNGLGSIPVPGGEWTVVEKEFTIPEDYVPMDDDRLGVYFNPENEKGITFYVDDIAVELVD